MLSDLLKDYVNRHKPIQYQTNQLDVLVYVTEVKDTPSACFTGFFVWMMKEIDDIEYSLRTHNQSTKSNH